MNSIEKLERRLRAEFRDIEVRLERPKLVEGRYWLDVDADGHVVTVVWKREEGFGVSAPVLEMGYGEGAEETFQSVDAAFVRIADLIRGREHTRPPVEVVLQELRARLGIAQTDLAAKLDLRQGSVSKMERREDMQVRTLARYISALGGSLELLARFPDNEPTTFRICQFAPANAEQERGEAQVLHLRQPPRPSEQPQFLSPSSSPWTVPTVSSATSR